MDLLPEWAPNIHPLLVHFPIGLLIAAVLLDAVALLFRKQEGLRVAAVSLFVLGALGALASFFSGRIAADSVNPSPAANVILTDHADWALWTVWFFGIYGLIRLAVLIFDKQQRLAVLLPLFLIGAGGLFLLYETAEHGAQMVFKHGVGVQAVTEMQALMEELQVAGLRAQTLAAGPVADDNGSWHWAPGTHAAEGLVEAFTWLAGDTSRVVLETRPDAAQDTVLALQLQRDSVLFVFDQPIRSIQADVMLNLDQFDGTVMLVHHVQDAGTYGFLALEKRTMQQGTRQAGEETLMDEKPSQGTGWRQLRVVADKTHFRGYAGGTLITHGHRDELPTGPVGLRLAGTGTVLLGSMTVVSLRE